MANDQTFVAIMSSLSMGISGLSYLIAFVYAVTQLGRYPKAAKLLLVGVLIWSVAFVSSIFTNLLLSRFVQAEDMLRYIMIGNLFQSCLYALGLCFVVAAVFTDRTSNRHSQDEFLPSDQVETGDNSGNPFNSPRTR